MRKEDVYAELSEIVAGENQAGSSDDEIIIFDSTGVAIEDAAAAAIVYEKACAAKSGTISNSPPEYEMDHSQENQGRCSGIHGFGFFFAAEEFS